MFVWLRQMVKNAVLNGVQDAVDVLRADEAAPEPTVLQLEYSRPEEPEQNVRPNGRKAVRQ